MAAPVAVIGIVVIVDAGNHSRWCGGGNRGRRGAGLWELVQPATTSNTAGQMPKHPLCVIVSSGRLGTIDLHLGFSPCLSGYQCRIVLIVPVVVGRFRAAEGEPFR
jgi:hypothetical protein